MLTWPAPAKLNLFLHITGRRPDGYHNLQTVFQFIDYGDELHFVVRNDGVLREVCPLPGVNAQTSLILRAARLLQQTTGVNLGADITLTKRLPIGGGLGGGSSDAATTLVALNRLWRLNLTPDELARLGLNLGADVPVFVHGQAAWAEGVGERLSPVALEEPWYVVITPPCRVSTKEIFACADLTRDTKPITIRDFLGGVGGNDCEALVCRRYPEIAEALGWLTTFAPARLTGTGACVFAPCQDEQHARDVMQQLAREKPVAWQTFVAKGMNQSPLHHYISTM